MTRYLFIGEKPSLTANRRGWTWESGRLAAHTLFRALRACGINPEDREAVRFLNLFGDDPADPEVACASRLTKIEGLRQEGWTVVAMGLKVSRPMTGAKLPHLMITHPAARGAIRGRQVYVEHVKGVLAA